MRQLNKSTRRLAASALVIVAGPVAIGSAAYACQSLATLRSTGGPISVQAGQTVTLFGKRYGDTTSASQAPLSNIEVHLDKRTGQVLASIAPTPGREFTATVTIPAGTAVGTHTLVATQYQGNGDLVSGAPGLLSIEVTGAAGRTSSAAGPVEASSTPVAATPAAPAAATAAPAAAVTPAANAGSASTATAPAATTTANAAPAAATAPAASTAAAVDAPSTPAAAAAEVVAPVPTAGSATTSTGFLPASSSSSSTLPGLSLVAALAMVLLALGAFVKTSRTMVSRNSTLAG